MVRRRRKRKYELELESLVVVFENLPPFYILAHSSLFAYTYTIGALFIQKEEGKEKHDDPIVGIGGDSSRFNCC